MSDYATNKKLKRAVKYDVPPNTDGTPARATFNIDDKGELEFIAIVSVDEAHRWLHGTESIRDAGAPDVDQMLEAIANKLQEDARTIMEHCATSEGWLYDMYALSKKPGLSVRPVQR